MKVASGGLGHVDNVMRIIPPRHIPGPTGNLIADAVSAGLRARFAKTAEEPIPEKLIAIIHRIEEKWSSSSCPDRGSDDELK
jgi:hypothetical protein